MNRTARRLLTATASATVLCLTALGSPASATAATSGCHPKGARTLAGSAEVRAYARQGIVYACRLANGRKYRLGISQTAQEDGRRGVAEVTAGGRYVAYVLHYLAESSQGPFGVDHIRLVRIDRLRMKRVSVGDTGCANPIGDYGYTGAVVPTIALTAKATLAWTCTTAWLGALVSEVHKFDLDGPGLLDTDRERPNDPIDASSLALSASRSGTTRLYWTTRSGPRAAELRS